MKKSQQGFTLIELVMVTVILGILSAVALPKFVDLKDDALQAAVQGVAGALSSGTSINYVAYSVGNPAKVTVASCDDAKLTLTGGAYPSSQGTFTATMTSGVWVNAVGTSNDCTLTLTPESGSVITAKFSSIAVP